MGYDFHITRADPWWENDDRPIAPEEWLKIVEDDPELRLDPANGPYFATWLGDSELDGPWLDWDDGRISTKNPDRALLDKMLDIARRLGANVLGDDGEPYLGKGRFGGDSRRESVLSRVVGLPWCPLAVAVVSGVCIVVSLMLDERFRLTVAPSPYFYLGFAYLLLACVGMIGLISSSALAVGALVFRRGVRYAVPALVVNAATISYLIFVA
ncbi:MAG TPA: hypothetical protein VMY37_30695 [Thermoguttaceae bacterium]|nr:hypothetical protein [Thermoguttaceae bacterium]